MTDSAERFIRKTFRQSPSLFISLITGDTIFHATWTKTNSRNRIGTENMLHVRSLFHLLVPSPCPNRGAATSAPDCRPKRYRGRGVRWNRSGNALPDRTNRPADVGRSEGAAGKRPDGEGWMDNNLQPAAKGIRFAQRATRAGSASPGTDARCILRQALRPREARRLKAVMVAIILYQFFHHVHGFIGGGNLAYVVDSLKLPLERTIRTFQRDNRF